MQHVGLFIPLPGIKPVSPAVEVWSLNHWTTRQVSAFAFLWVIISPSKLLEAEIISVTGCS